jgi:hypothetical protein
VQPAPCAHGESCTSPHPSRSLEPTPAPRLHTIVNPPPAIRGHLGCLSREQFARSIPPRAATCRLCIIAKHIARPAQSASYVCCSGEAMAIVCGRASPAYSIFDYRIAGHRALDVRCDTLALHITLSVCTRAKRCCLGPWQLCTALEASRTTVTPAAAKTCQIPSQCIHTTLLDSMCTTDL